MEENKHIVVMWIKWGELWAKIKDPREEMRFFPTMKNMVEKYPTRADLASLEGRPQSRRTTSLAAPQKVQKGRLRQIIRRVVQNIFVNRGR